MNDMNDEDRRRHDKSWNDPPLFSIEQMNDANRPKTKPLAKRYSAPLAPEVAGRRPSFGQTQQYAQSSFPSQPSPTGWQQNSGYPSQAPSFGYGSVPPAPAPLPPPSYGQAPAQVPAFPPTGVPVQTSTQQHQQWPQQQQPAPIPQSSNFASPVPSSGYQQSAYPPAGQTAASSAAYSYAAPAPYQPPGSQVPANRLVPELGAGAYQQQQQQQGLGVSVTGSLSGPIPAAGLAPNFAASIPHQGRQSVPYSNAGPVHQYPVSNQPISGTVAPIPAPNYYSNQYQYQ